MLQTKSGRLRDGLVKLKEITECPVCLESVGTSVVQCLRGHGFCNRCRLQMDECPLCKDSFSIHKPTMLISILERLPKLCENNNYGCKEIAFGLNHELFCKYRDIACKIGKFRNCEWEGSVKDFKAHVERHHGAFYAMYSFGVSIKLHIKNFKGDWHTKQYLHVVENHLFLVFAHKDQNSKRFFLVIKQIPLGQANEEYYFSVKFSKQHLVFKHTIKACFTYSKYEQFEKSPHCMIVPLEEMDYFMVPDSSSFEVTFKALKI